MKPYHYYQNNSNKYDKFDIKTIVLFVVVAFFIIMCYNFFDKLGFAEDCNDGRLYSLQRTYG